MKGDIALCLFSNALMITSLLGASSIVMQNAHSMLTPNNLLMRIHLQLRSENAPKKKNDRMGGLLVLRWMQVELICYSVELGKVLHIR